MENEKSRWLAIDARSRMEFRIDKAIKSAIKEFHSTTGLYVADITVLIDNITPVGSDQPMRDYKYCGLRFITGVTNDE